METMIKMLIKEDYYKHLQLQAQDVNTMLEVNLPHHLMLINGLKQFCKDLRLYLINYYLGHKFLKFFLKSTLFLDLHNLMNHI